MIICDKCGSVHEDHIKHCSFVCSTLADDEEIAARRDGPGMETDSDAKIRLERSEGKRHVTVDLRDVKKGGTCHVPQGDTYRILMGPGLLGGVSGGSGRKAKILASNGNSPEWVQPPHEWMHRPQGSSRFGWWLAGMLGLRRRWLEGPIYVGDEFIWEPDKPNARQHVRVSQVFWNGETNTIQCTWKDGHYPCINDEARFREACVRSPKKD